MPPKAVPSFGLEDTSGASSQGDDRVFGFWSAACSSATAGDALAVTSRSCAAARGTPGSSRFARTGAQLGGTHGWRRDQTLGGAVTVPQRALGLMSRRIEV